MHQTTERGFDVVKRWCMAWCL